MCSLEREEGMSLPAQAHSKYKVHRSLAPLPPAPLTYLLSYQLLSSRRLLPAPRTLEISKSESLSPAEVWTRASPRITISNGTTNPQNGPEAPKRNERRLRAGEEAERLPRRPGAPPRRALEAEEYVHFPVMQRRIEEAGKIFLANGSILVSQSRRRRRTSYTAQS